MRTPQQWVEGLGHRLPTFEPARSARGRLALTLTALGLMFALVLPLFHDPVDHVAVKVHGGVADFARYAAGAMDRPVDLGGEWRAVWLGDNGAGPPPGTTAKVRVPGQWYGVETDRGPLPQSGLLRYETVLKGLPPGPYQMHVPEITGASRVLVDGQVVSTRGVFAADKAQVRNEVRSHRVALVSTGRDIRIGIEIAALLHRDNGLESAPVLGRPQVMEDFFALYWARVMLNALSLMLIAALGIALFLYRPNDRASLFFGIACLMFLPNSLIVGFDNVLLMAFPSMSFQTMMGIQYFGGTIAAAFFFAASHTLFQNESPRIVFGAFIGFFVAHFLSEIVFFLILNDTLTASRVQRLFIGVTLAMLLWVVVIVGRATLRGREGALVFMIGIALFVILFTLQSLVTEGWVSADRARGYDFVSLGVLMALYSQMLLMAERFSLAVIRAEDSNRDLRELLAVNTAITSDLQLRPLLERIVGVTSQIIHADRTSLFLAGDMGVGAPRRAGKGEELAAMVAEGVGAGQIAIASGTGLVGHSFRTGEVVAVPDAYADPRFNPEIDKQTGYRTRSVLSIPITTRDGRRLGVMQALNRLDGLPFDAEDVTRMSAFGAQAAVALDNARLFSDLLAERNFDESILRSMAGGVIALDSDWHATKINRAAGAILGIDEEAVAGSDARPIVEASNPSLVAEIEAVLAGAEAKSLLDYDLVVPGGETRSVNLSIVPFDAGESGGAGALIVIEDLSSEKRLQSAMRRFLTQDVVDQVLGREDGLLFGTACNASVLFADVRGFTTMAEQLTARETVETLNELFGELVEAVVAHEGVLDKFMGDGIMAVYGAPLSRGADAENAVASAVGMIRALAVVNARRAERGAGPLRIGIGVTSGEVVAGTIGSPKRMDYTVIGDTVNLAARIETATRDHGVDLLICERTAGLVGHRFPVRLVDRIHVKGRVEPCAVYTVDMDALAS